jgi:uncharacterized RDD family membrane protein YckC
MSHPPGWYPDPQPAPGSPDAVRWWDGQRWTEVVHQSAGPTPPTAAGPTTPDGEPLAGWWIRFGAYLIDAVIVLVVAVIVGFPLVARIGEAYADLYRDILRAAESETQRPDQMEVFSEIWWPLLAFSLLSIALNFAYHVFFLRWRAATPGKLMLGLRVRLRDRPGPLGWETILRRWVAQFGANLLSLLPFVGLIAGVYPWVDGLWPLWDERRQALHDKFGRTNVVRTRRQV